MLNESGGRTLNYRTPQQALKYTRFMVLNLLGILPMFSFVIWFMSTDGWSHPRQFVTPALLGVLAFGVLVSALSASVGGWIGQRTARKWAESGLRGDQLQPAGPIRSEKIFGVDIGAAAIAPVPAGLWDRFSIASITASAMPECALLCGFVVSFMTERLSIFAAGAVTYLAFWAYNFPRKSHWDRWAQSAGLELPWHLGGSGNPAAETLPPPPDARVMPHQ